MAPEELACHVASKRKDFWARDPSQPSSSKTERERRRRRSKEPFHGSFELPSGWMPPKSGGVGVRARRAGFLSHSDFFAGEACVDSLLSVVLVFFTERSEPALQLCE